MGEFKVEGFEYIPSSPATLKQGVKGNRIPQNAVAGDNGSFIIAGEPPKAVFYCDSGLSVNCYDVMRQNIYAVGRSRVTKKYAEKICNPIVGMEFEDPKGLIKEVLHNMQEKQ